MPTVPRYTGRVKEDALPSVRYSNGSSAEAFGGGASGAAVGAAASDLANAAVKIHLAEKQKADEIAFQDADLKASMLATNLEMKVKQLKGQNALGAKDIVDQEWAAGISEIEKNIKSSNVKPYFNTAAQERYNTLNKATETHFSSQMEVWDKESTKSYIDQARQSAIVGYEPGMPIGDIEMRAQQSIKDQFGSINARAQRAGTGPADAELATARSMTHKDLVTKMLASGDSATALEYFNKYGGEMLDSSTISKQIQAERLRVNARDSANTILSSTDGSVEAIKKADEIEDTELRTATLKEINTQLKAADNLRKKEESERKRAYSSNIYTLTDLLAKDKLTEGEIEKQVLSGAITPDDASMFRTAQSAKDWNTDSKSTAMVTAEAGQTYFDTIQALDKGVDISDILKGATDRFANGKLNQQDMTWILRAVELKNRPEEQGMWKSFESAAKQAFRALGAAGGRAAMRSWDFKTDAQEHVHNFINQVVSSEVGVDKAPKYLMNAYGFMRQVFDGKPSDDGSKK